MLDQIMRSPTFDYIERGLSAANLRHEVIADNLANINTPNFKRSQVVFEELLAKEIHGDSDDGKLPLVRTHDKHLPVGKFAPAQARVERDDSTTMRADNNNVDIDMDAVRSRFAFSLPEGCTLDLSNPREIAVNVPSRRGTVISFK